MVEGGGFEPPKDEPSDLQSDPFGRSGTPPLKKRHFPENRPSCQQLKSIKIKLVLFSHKL